MSYDHHYSSQYLRIASCLAWTITKHFAKKVDVLDHWLEELVVLETFVMRKCAFEKMAAAISLSASAD